MANYEESSFASRPKTLDPNEYYNLSPEYRRAEEARAAIRANLKRQFLLKLNNPETKGPFDDPAVTRWVYARTANIYPNFRHTFKTVSLGLTFFVAPLVILYNVFKTNRKGKEDLIKAGALDRKYSMSS